MDKPFLPHHDFLTLLSDQMLTAQKITAADSTKRDLVCAPEHSPVETENFPLDPTIEIIVEDEWERARRAGKRGESRPYWQDTEEL